MLLSFYRNMYLHLRTAHTMFGCTASIVYGLCYFQMYIVRQLHVYFLSGRISW